MTKAALLRSLWLFIACLLVSTIVMAALTIILPNLLLQKQEAQDQFFAAHYSALLQKIQNQSDPAKLRRDAITLLEAQVAETKAAESYLTLPKGFFWGWCSAFIFSVGAGTCAYKLGRNPG